MWENLYSLDTKHLIPLIHKSCYRFWKKLPTYQFSTFLRRTSFLFIFWGTFFGRRSRSCSSVATCSWTLVSILAIIRAPIWMFRRNFGGRFFGEITFVERYVACVVVFIATVGWNLLRKETPIKILQWPSKYGTPESHPEHYHVVVIAFKMQNNMLVQ